MKLHLRTFMMALLGAASLCSMAQMITLQKGNEFNSTIIQLDESKFDKQESEGFITYTPKQVIPSKLNGTENVTFYVQLDYDKTIYTPQLIRVVGENVNYSKSCNTSNNTYEISLPNGTYDIIVLYKDALSKVHYVFQENVAATEGVTFTLAAADANIPVVAITYDIHGNQLKPDYYDSAGPSRKLIEEGNIIDGQTIYAISSKKYGDLFATMVGFAPRVQGNTCDCYVSQLSDDYVITYGGYILSKNKEVYGFTFNQAGADKNLSLIKKPTDYIAHTITSRWLPLSYENMLNEGYLEAEGSGYPLGASLYMQSRDITIYNRIAYLDYRFNDENITYYLDMPLNTFGVGYTSFFAPIYWSDIQVVTWDDGTQYPNHEGMAGLPMYTEGNVVKYSDCGAIGFGSGSQHALTRIEDDGFLYPLIYPGHPVFSFDSENAHNISFGNSCPLMVSETTTDDWGYTIPRALEQFYPIGRYGEGRTADLFHMQETFKHNGTLLYEGTYNSDLMFDYLYDSIADFGVIDQVLINPNILVDDLVGQNVSTIHFDMTKEDFVYPSITMLQFRNLENQVTDRFEKASDGIVMLSGGDLIFDNWDWYYPSCREAEVEVNYSPYAQDNWKALVVEEVPENHYMPGFGNFYQGSLKDVEGEGEKGWFDLKIKMTDASGNWQEQVISPAFCLKDHEATDINDVLTTNNAAEIEAIYSIDGKRLSSMQNGINIVRYTDGTARKVLVK